jgi:hypothetical protein
LEDDEPRLPADWFRAAGVVQGSHGADAGEPRELRAALELLIQPYVTREEADTPDDAASVRILAYLMPETSE